MEEKGDFVRVWWGLRGWNVWNGFIMILAFKLQGSISSQSSNIFKVHFEIAGSK